MVTMKAPPGTSSVSVPQEDGSTYQIRPENGVVEVAEEIAAALTSLGFEAVVSPKMTDDALDDLRARRDALRARLDDLEAQEAGVAADGAAASSRLESSKAGLASAATSLDEVRASEQTVSETKARAVLIAEAVAAVREELAEVSSGVDSEESIRDYIRQTSEAAPLIEAAAAEVEGFAQAILAARDALVARSGIIDKLREECPLVAVPTLRVKDLGAVLQAALSDSGIERDAMMRTNFERLAVEIIAGPVFKPTTVEVEMRLGAVMVGR